MRLAIYLPVGGQANELGEFPEIVQIRDEDCRLSAYFWIRGLDEVQPVYLERGRGWTLGQVN